MTPLPPTAHVLDLTSRLGSYALQQLGVRSWEQAGFWPGLPLSPLPQAHRVDWDRPEASAAPRVPAAHCGGLMVLIGPGAMVRLPALLALVQGFSGPVSLLLAPSAIVEEAHLRAPGRALPAHVQVFRLPFSDPQSLWLVLMEQITKLPGLDLNSLNTPESPYGEPPMSSNLKPSMEAIMTIDGALAAALVDHRSGMCLAQAGSGMNLDLAAAGNTEVVRAKLKTVESLGLRRGIEDILITLVDQYHLIRLVPNHSGLFLYLVLDKNKGNLALARYKLMDIERGLKV